VRGGSYGPSPIRSMSQLANTKQPSALDGYSMNNCGTKHKVMLPTSKLNSSDSQVWGQVSFATSTGVTPTGEGHSCLVQECYAQGPNSRHIRRNPRTDHMNYPFATNTTLVYRRASCIHWNEIQIRTYGHARNADDDVTRGPESPQQC
jgi:hypothetical protein